MSRGWQVRLIRPGLGLAPAVLLALPVAAPLFAQQTVIEAQVEQIACSDIYALTTPTRTGAWVRGRCSWCSGPMARTRRVACG